MPTPRLYTYADHASTEPAADAEADTSTHADTDAAADHVAALARTVAETYAQAGATGRRAADAGAIPVADRTARRPHH